MHSPPPSSPATSKTRAMTLLELMVATFLLSVGGLALLQGLYFSKKTTDDGQKKLAIFNLARSYLDQLRGLKNAELDSPTFTLYHTDGTSSSFTEDAWTEVPPTVMALVAPGVRLQIKPSIILEDTPAGDWYRIQLAYRYAWGRMDGAVPQQWPASTLQALASKLDNSYTIALTPTTEIFLQTNQQPERWPSERVSVHPKYYDNTIPLPPVPPPLAWVPTPPPLPPGTPVPPYTPPPQNQNNSSSL